MHALIVIAKRELKSYYNSPLAYVFMFIFTLLVCGTALFPTFEILGRSFGGLLEQEECNLFVFFEAIPFFLAFFVPALAMKLWADERKKGTIELLFTYPLSAIQVILGKFVAAWIVVTFALLMTFPMILMVNTIGKIYYPLVFWGYIASILLAGAFIAIASAASALTKNSIVSLIIGVSTCSFLVGINLISFKIGILESFLRVLGALGHFDALVTGQIGLASIVYFISIMIGCFFLNLYFLETK